MIVAIWIVSIIISAFVLIVLGLAWLKARAAKSDPEHARHD